MALAHNGRNAASTVDLENVPASYAPNAHASAATTKALSILGTATASAPSRYGWQPEIRLKPDHKWA